jgi:hypothetical protein
MNTPGGKCWGFALTRLAQKAPSGAARYEKFIENVHDL